jgi:hypothetical protein
VPFVRFSRDRRGYEHIYLIDSSAERGGRSRILFWFRTPPGVKVGRSPFDSETQRSLERQNPGVQFDWAQIVAARIPPPVPVENWREKRRAERAIKRARAAEAAEAADTEGTAADTSVSLSDELEDDDLDDLVPDEVDVPDGGRPEQLDAQPEEELSPAAAPAPEGATAPQVAQKAPAEARRRRRRRHRRRQPGPGEPASRQNGPLDQAKRPEEPSNEG